MRLIPYHTRLAWRSLRRDPGLSATIIIVLAVAACIFSTALIHWLRLYGPRPALSPGLHQVEISVDDRALRVAFIGSSAAPSKLALASLQTRNDRTRRLMRVGEGTVPRAPGPFSVPSSVGRRTG